MRLVIFLGAICGAAAVFLACVGLGSLVAGACLRGVRYLRRRRLARLLAVDLRSHAAHVPAGVRAGSGAAALRGLRPRDAGLDDRPRAARILNARQRAQLDRVAAIHARRRPQTGDGTVTALDTTKGGLS